MNYIKKLQDENSSLKSQIKETNREINDFIHFLNTDKFIGVQSDGTRKDWISTGDVIERLKNIRLNCLEGEMPHWGK